jgi:hypothetical protein
MELDVFAPNFFSGQEETLDIVIPYQIRIVGVNNKQSTACFAIV